MDQKLSEPRVHWQEILHIMGYTFYLSPPSQKHLIKNPNDTEHQRELQPKNLPGTYRYDKLLVSLIHSVQQYEMFLD